MNNGDDKLDQKTKDRIKAENVFTAKLEAIKKEVIKQTVLDVFKKLDLVKSSASSISDADLIDYLDLQGNYYMQKDIELLSKADQHLMMQAKNDWIAQKNAAVMELSASLGEPSFGRAREAVTQQSNGDVVFRTSDSQPGMGGVLVGSNSNWCSAYTQLATKMRYSSSYRYDLACVASSMLYVSSFGNGVFAESQNVFLLSVEPPLYSMQESLLFGDFNGNGKDELGIITSQGLCIFDRAESGYWYSTGYHKPWGARPWYTVQEGGVRVGDFNGDGRDDIWYHDKKCWPQLFEF